MADAILFHAERRERAGKGAARATRKAGLVPAVIYGNKREPALIAVQPRELTTELHKPGFRTKLYDVQLDGATETVLVRDIQLHPVTDRALHVDFLRIDPNTKVTVEVPVTFANEALSPGLKRGGVVNIVRHTIEVECLAANIPSEIRIDLTGLDIGQSVHISSIALPEGVKPTIARDFTVATIVAPTIMAVETEAAPTETVETEVITAKEGKDVKEGEEVKEAKGKEPRSKESKGKEPKAKEAKGKDAKGKDAKSG
jgi:large subunit ribosomal protein L25